MEEEGQETEREMELPFVLPAPAAAPGEELELQVQAGALLHSGPSNPAPRKDERDTQTPASRRDTGTGAVLEQMVLPAIERGGYEYFRQVDIGERLGGGRHVVDLIAYDHHQRGYLISLKWQQTSGTAEQKVPFEAMCLMQAVLQEPERYERAYLVLGGTNWRLREFYTEGGLTPFFKHEALLSIVSLETFVARANRAQL
jgi:hypothetical protein